MNVDGFRFYFGCASGSSRKALRELNEPDVMINYATQNNRPWEHINRLFVDSGGYSLMLGEGEYTTSNDEYLAYLEQHDPHRFALRDYPCEPDVLDEHNRTVEAHQQRTTDRHTELLKLLPSYAVTGSPVAVVQGWQPREYVAHVEQLADAGVLSRVAHVAIGSVCRRNAEQDIRAVIRAVADALPEHIEGLHAFGVKSSVLRYADVQDLLTTADSQSFELGCHWQSPVESKSWRDSAFGYLKQRRRLQETLRADESQQELTAYR